MITDFLITLTRRCPLAGRQLTQRLLAPGSDSWLLPSQPHMNSVIRKKPFGIRYRIFAKMEYAGG
jgi:hypothetical protein